MSNPGAKWPHSMGLPIPCSVQSVNSLKGIASAICTSRNSSAYPLKQAVSEDIIRISASTLNYCVFIVIIREEGCQARLLNARCTLP